MTQIIEIPVSDELLRLIDQRARSAGLARAEYIRAVLSNDATGERSVDDILAPFRDQVAASGTNDEELDSLFAQARAGSYEAKNPRERH
jgi:hypothetical protein